MNGGIPNKVFKANKVRVFPLMFNMCEYVHVCALLHLQSSILSPILNVPAISSYPKFSPSSVLILYVIQPLVKRDS